MWLRGRSICLLFFHKKFFLIKTDIFVNSLKTLFYLAILLHFASIFGDSLVLYFDLCSDVFFCKFLWHVCTIHEFLTRPLVGFSRWIAHCDPQGAGQSVGKVRFCLKISNGNDSGNDSKQISSYSTSVRITPTRCTLLI